MNFIKYDKGYRSFKKPFAFWILKRSILWKNQQNWTQRIDSTEIRHLTQARITDSITSDYATANRFPPLSCNCQFHLTGYCVFWYRVQIKLFQTIETYSCQFREQPTRTKITILSTSKYLIFIVGYHMRGEAISVVEGRVMSRLSAVNEEHTTSSWKR